MTAARDGVTPPGPDAPSGQWVLLSYRLPREPSTPRIAVWRKLERFGVARLGDGLVALPADARTREQLDWIADEVVEAGGAATVWLATPTSEAQEQQVARAMQDARAAEYQAIIDQVRSLAADDDPGPVARRLRDQLRRIARRDFYPPPQRDLAHTLVTQLAAADPAKSGPAPAPHHRRTS